MSHIVSVNTRIHDLAAINAACQRLGLPQPVQGTANLYSGEASGLLLQLPGWQYPAVIDLQSGIVKYDNYDGAWGEKARLDRFLQIYAVEMAKLEARKKGYAASELALADGSIRVQIVEGA